MKVLAFNGSGELRLLDAGYLPYDDDKGVRLFSFTRVVDRSQYGYGLDYRRMTIGPGLIFNLLL